MTKITEKELDKFDRKVLLTMILVLLPMAVIAILIFPSINIAVVFWSGFFCAVIGYLSFKHSIVFGDYFLYHWTGKTARIWARVWIIVGFLLMSGVLYFSYF